MTILTIWKIPQNSPRRVSALCLPCSTTFVYTLLFVVLIIYFIEQWYIDPVILGGSVPQVIFSKAFHSHLPEPSPRGVLAHSLHDNFLLKLLMSSWINMVLFKKINYQNNKQRHVVKHGEIRAILTRTWFGNMTLVSDKVPMNFTGGVSFCKILIYMYWKYITIVSLWWENMLGYLSADIICSEKEQFSKSIAQRKLWTASRNR